MAAPYLIALFHNPSQAYPLAGFIFLAGLISGVGTYFILKRKHDPQLRELSSLITQMKKIEEEETNGKSAEGITESALSVADKILTLLPELVRKRNQDSLLFGAVAIVITATLGGNFAVAILVGIIVWLYFRYETRKTYDQEISNSKNRRESSSKERMIS